MLQFIRNLEIPLYHGYSMLPHTSFVVCQSSCDWKDNRCPRSKACVGECEEYLSLFQNMCIKQHSLPCKWPVQGGLEQMTYHLAIAWHKLVDICLKTIHSLAKELRTPLSWRNGYIGCYPPPPPPAKWFFKSYILLLSSISWSNEDLGKPNQWQVLPAKQGQK